MILCGFGVMHSMEEVNKVEIKQNKDELLPLPHGAAFFIAWKQTEKKRFAEDKEKSPDKKRSWMNMSF